MKSFAMLLAAVLFAFTLSACDSKGPAEKAGENIDEFGQEMQHEADEAGDKMENKYEDMKEKDN